MSVPKVKLFAEDVCSHGCGWPHGISCDAPTALGEVCNRSYGHTGRHLRRDLTKVTMMAFPLSSEDVTLLRAIAKRFGEGKRRNKILALADKIEGLLRES